ncbi:hypothetical protein RvY_01068 [Ramazzottius varieornatus]|uniref:F-box domain-containing protein n=1 Tax=Ramazzottius varieornatus TaxID=947166 RepID=A0A1D1UM66_RAMVA|nr:hypothetical protein RvY_01068 [Ramazzottius varieornatus]
MEGTPDGTASVDGGAPTETALPGAESVIEHLPYDVLLLLSKYMRPQDLIGGLSACNKQLHKMFASSEFWEERIRTACKDYHSFLEKMQRSAAVPDPQFWQKRVSQWQTIHHNFLWNNLNAKLLGEENQQYLGNFRALSFAGQGRCLAYIAKDRYSTSVWKLGDRSLDNKEPELITFKDHDQRMMSLRSLGNSISTGAWDGFIAVRDLERSSGAPSAKFCSAGFIMDHAWQENCIVCGTRGGLLEIFDIRAGEDSQARGKLFSPSAICNDIKMHMKDHDLIIAGWDNGVRIIKKFDLRNYETVADVEPGTYNVSMAVSDNRVFVGADRGKVMEFDGTFLELVHDYSAAFGHVKNLGWLPDVAFLECVRSIKYADGHVFTADLRQVKVHEVANMPKLLWEEEIVFSELAFCKERCMLAAAVGYTPDQIKLFTPKP